jgi:hypothetical protein
MLKIRKIVGILAASLCLGLVLAPAAFADPISGGSSYDASAKTVTIGDADGLLWLSKQSKEGNTFAGYTVSIKTNIDLKESGNWTPLEDFKGIIDGKIDDNTNAVISGMTVNVTGQAAGFCSTASGAQFKNLTIKDSSVYTNNEYAGAFAGDGFTSSFENCEAINVSVTGKRFVGGIVGSAYGNITNCKVNSGSSASKMTITVINPEALVTSLTDGDNVGGIIGYIGEGSTLISDCEVNGVEVIGARQVGGISGFANYGNTISNCKVLNSEICANSKSTRGVFSRTPNVGGLVGQFNKATVDERIIVKGNTVDGTTVTQTNGRSCYAGWAVGDATSYGATSECYEVENILGSVTVTYGSKSSTNEIGHE